MRHLLSVAAGAVFVTAANIAPAQSDRVLQGPLLLPPGSDGGSYYRDGTPFYLGSGYDRDRRDPFDHPEGYYDHRHHGHYHGPVRYSDPQMRLVAQWYRDALDRPMTRGEERHWSLHLRNGGSAQTAIAAILGSDEYYERAGGRFDLWIAHLERATSRHVDPHEAAEWRESYRRSRDRVAVRTEIAGHFITEHEEEPVVVPGYGPAPGRPGYDVPWYAREVDHGHRRTTAYAPAGRPRSEAELINSWYQAHFGREIAPRELNKWLSDLNKGVSLEEVHASVLGAPEWFDRAGGTPTRWIAATLMSLGQSNDPDAVRYWLDRYRRNDGDLYETALEMVRSAGGHGRRADHDHDDDD